MAKKSAESKESDAGIAKVVSDGVFRRADGASWPLGELYQAKVTVVGRSGWSLFTKEANQYVTTVEEKVEGVEVRGA